MAQIDAVRPQFLLPHRLNDPVKRGGEDLPVTAVDTAEAEQVPGVVRVFTCFDVPENCFPTAGHPWSTDPRHQDVCDRLLLSRHVRYYGDDVAVVVAEDDGAQPGGQSPPVAQVLRILRPACRLVKGIHPGLAGGGSGAGQL